MQSRRDGRVVKALDSKSNGIFPHRFESCSRRNLFIFFTFINVIFLLSFFAGQFKLSIFLFFRFHKETKFIEMCLCIIGYVYL